MKFQTPKLEDLQPLLGLEGPYQINQTVVYFDPKKNQYWDPASDYYLEDDEIINFVNGRLTVVKL